MKNKKNGENENVNNDVEQVREKKSKEAIEEQIQLLAENENTKLTMEEVNSVQGIENYSLREKQELIDFVYNISLVLFKSFENEQS